MWRVWETFQREQFGGKVPATPVVSGVLAETASMISATENSISLPRGGTGAAATPPSPQDTSAGRISVATRPGASCDAATAAAASAPTLVVLSDLAVLNRADAGHHSDPPLHANPHRHARWSRARIR
jgi:hypothetical protein